MNHYVENGQPCPCESQPQNSRTKLSAPLITTASCRRDASGLVAKPLECGEFSPLSAGDLSPPNVVRRAIPKRTLGSGGFSRRSTRRCLADQSARRKKRRQVAALQRASTFVGVCRQALMGKQAS
jgi:hypothetical protein